MPEFKSRSLKTAAILNLGLCLIVAASPAFSQYEDTAEWHRNKVKTVESWVNFMQFENSDDTCLYEIKQINRQGKMTSLKQNYMCHGWDMVAETEFEYDDMGRLIVIQSTQNDNIMSQTQWHYDSLGRVVKEEVKNFEPFSLIFVSNVYYGPGDTPDSMISTRITNGDTVLYHSKFRYEKGHQTREDLVNRTLGEPVSSHALEYDEKGRVVLDKFILMQSYDDDEITRITYNKLGRIQRSQSEINKSAAEFWYGDNGLVAQTFYYNKFETMERQMFHKYSFWE